MKKYLIPFLLLFCFSSGSMAQTHGGFHGSKVNMATVLANKQSPLVLGFSSVSEARTIINDILDVVDQQQNFEVVSTNQIDNAAAMFYNGRRYILYNPRFISQLDNAANDKWAGISVLAHEIGHHLLGHTMDGRGSQHAKELASDQFSGLVLRRMGATLQQAQLAMSLISSPHGSASHPGKNDRLAAIAKGWGATNVRSNEQRDVASIPSNGRVANPATRPVQQQQRRVITYPQRQAAQSIVYKVQFKGNNRNQYYITSQNNVVVVSGNRVQTVAKIASTNKSNFPYVIYDDRLQLYVDRRGNIFLNTGQSVGQITKA
jgi:hypothetical protein